MAVTTQAGASQKTDEQSWMAATWASLVALREVIAILGLIGLGAFLRLWQLGEIPYGLHNDEGNVTLDAQRILREGWIGPYSLLANGYPIGVNYFVAPFIKILGPGVIAVRLPMAILGIVAIPLAYFVFRNAGGWRVALCGTFLLVTSSWHVHYSRLGFPVIAWPVIELAALLLLQLGLRKRQWPFFAASGLVAGLGIWVYPSAALFTLAMGAYMGIWVLVRLARHRDTPAVRDMMLIGILGLSMVLGGWPMIEYQRQNQAEMEGRLEGTYIFSDFRRDKCEQTPVSQRDQACTWAVADSNSDKLNVVWDKTHLFWEILTTRARPDGVDGLGVKPPVGELAMYLAVVGFVIAAIRFRNPAMGISVLAVPLIVLSTVVTIDGQFRRSFGLMPLFAMFGGLTLGLAWEWADKQRLAVRIACLSLIAGSLGAISVQGLRFYFNDYPESRTARVLFYPGLLMATEYVDSVGHPYVYWYNDRAPVWHETRRVLADEIAGGEDRGLKFTQAANKQQVRYDLKPEGKVAFPVTQEPDGAVFVFLDKYMDDVDVVAARYPGGELAGRYNTDLGLWEFRAYYLPKNLLDSYARQESIEYGIERPPE